MTNQDTRIIVKKTTRAKLKTMGRKGDSYDKIIQLLIAHLETRATLKALGRKGESYDQIIQRLIAHLEATQ